jgi:hypothetical protein
MTRHRGHRQAWMAGRQLASLWKADGPHWWWRWHRRDLPLMHATGVDKVGWWEVMEDGVVAVDF